MIADMENMGIFSEGGREDPVQAVVKAGEKIDVLIVGSLRRRQDNVTISYTATRTDAVLVGKTRSRTLSLTPEEAELRYRKLAGYYQEHPVFVALTEHPRVKGFVERILGNEASIFGDMALSKPPRIGVEKPWHALSL